jgi:hypothetical protein
MTSEVLIMNEDCIAITADSAVTVGSKTFKADKIFELSDTQPISIMIYGNASISNVSASLIIKEYRAQLKGKKFKTVSDCAKDFLNFLEKGGGRSLKTNPLITRERIDQRVMYCCNELLKGFLRELDDIFFGRNITEDDGESELEIEEIMDSIVNRSKNTEDPSVDEKAAGKMYDILKENEDICEMIASFPYYRGKPEDLLSILSCVLVSKNRIRSPTGIVIAGYGSEDVYPSYVELIVNGVFYDGLNYHVQSEVKIGVDRPSWIEAFAQDDVVQTYLYGLDPDLFGGMENNIRHMLDALTNTLFEILEGDDKKLEEIKRLNKRNVERYMERFQDHCEKYYLRPTEEAICHLSKDEMASMAESLVNFTSLKRHVSNDLDSVGGPVDVAIISKSEGFVWVKRKYYFDISLNPYYTERRRDQHGGGKK